MLSMTLFRQFMMNPRIILSFLIFLMTWYDATHAHVLTTALNDWILETLYVSSTVTGQWQEYYFGLLDFINVLGINQVFMVLTIVMFIVLVYGKHYKIALYSLAFIISVFALAWLLKHIVDSPRPMFPLEHDSFPSGHVIRVSILCGLLWWFNEIRLFQVPFPDWSKILLVAAPLLIGYARIGLGYHWLSDVLASYAMTYILFTLMRLCYAESLKVNPSP